MDENVDMAVLERFIASPFDAVCVLDEDGRFEYINTAGVALCGWPRDALIGKGFMKLIPPDRHRFMLERWNEVLHGQDRQFEAVIVTGAGERRILLLSQRRVVNGDTIKIFVTAKDITDQRRVEAQLETQRRQLEDKVRQRTAALVEINARLSRSEAALARAQATACMGSWEWDLLSNRPEWSLQMYRLYGLDPEKGVPPMEALLDFIHPADREGFKALAGDAIAKGESFQTEFRVVRNDGSLMDVQTVVRVETGADGRPLRLYGTLQDITERRGLEREIVEAGRHEQQRIGRDLHDSLGQELTGLALMAKALETQLLKADSTLSVRAAEVAALAGTAARRARDVAHGLSPVDIDAESLSSELRRMCERLNPLHGISCRFEIQGDERVHDHAVATHLYHIAQEALNNVVKHAGASEVRIVFCAGERGTLTVTDDGRGIRLPSRERPGGIGLRIMRHRAEIIGASLSIEPVSPGGTRIRCEFPNRMPVEPLPADKGLFA